MRAEIIFTIFTTFFFPPRNPVRDGKLLPFKKGGFHVALDAGMPILPVVISSCDFLDGTKKIFESGDVRIKFLRPIQTDKYSKETIDDLIELTRCKMQDAFTEISEPRSSDGDKKKD